MKQFACRMFNEELCICKFVEGLYANFLLAIS